MFTVDFLKKYSSQDVPIKISVMNPIGETLFNKSVTNTRFVEINLSKFSRGIYFIQVNDNGNISSSKVEIM
ncbi:MAG: T9SS type A sorting domain-containing protein [Bacteroidia bacterium]|nr:T9SS type A sorting domain-containing protein [Bacteroidia bacterium]